MRYVYPRVGEWVTRRELEIPAYDKPVTYLPQVNYLEKVTFHINTLSDGKKYMSDEKLKQEGQRIQNSVAEKFMIRIHFEWGY